MFRRFCIAFAIFACIGVYGFSQTGFGTDGTTGFAPSSSTNLTLARSSLDYMVTPGDVYTLVYAAGNVPVTYVIVVDTASRIRTANLGIVNGAGKTFAQARREVEALVTNNYPLSGPQLVLTEVASFEVFVDGEVETVGSVRAWGLTRLSTLAGDNLTERASIRDISIRSAGGQVQTYDLFRFTRYGEQSQNPYLRPGDVITFNRISRVLTIEGSVERPGTYQLLDGENFKELVEVYAGGFTEFANPSRMEMVRYVNSQSVAGDKIDLSAADVENGFVLENFDHITVPSITDLRPTLFVEGAVRGAWGGIESAEEMNVAAMGRLTVRFNTGETYATMVRRNIGWFSAQSDTKGAYVLRKGGRIPMNIEAILFDATYDDSIAVEDGDTLVVPFKQLFVTVAGAVSSPGTYPFSPGRNWEYYIAQAGGFMPTQNAMNKVTITDVNGKKMKKSDPIGPETMITASSNNFMFTVAPIITFVLSIIGVGLTAIDVLGTAGF
jgi:protein involved in polysaccharide export with SLBB domain